MRKSVVPLVLALVLAVSAAPPRPAAAAAARATSTAVRTTAPPVDFLAGDGDANTKVGVAEGGVAQRAAATATFQVTYTGFSLEAQAAFQSAVDIWSSLVTSSVPIKIDAEWKALGDGVLGSAGANGFWRDFGGAPQPGTFYPMAVVDAITGGDQDPGFADIEADFSSAYGSWYFGTDGNTPPGTHDFVTTVLHEIGHGLGFQGSMRVSAGTGAWGLGNPGEPVYPLAYDRFAENTAGTPLLNAATFPNPSAALRTALQSPVFFDGPKANVPDGGTRSKLYAPATWNGGSSFSHLDESLYYPGSQNSLMTPFGNTAEANHTPGPIALCMLEDMGWVTPETCAPPANDTFPGQVITGRSGTVSGTNIGATKQLGEPNHATSPGGASIWYSWTPPSTGFYTFTTAGSRAGSFQLDTVLALYVNGAVNGLSFIASNDEESPGTVSTSKVGPLQLFGGTTYRIAVDGWKAAGFPAANGLVTLAWSARSHAIADFDGDGSSERSVFRGGQWYAEGQAPAFFGLPGDIPVPGDYDGDGDVNRAVYRNGAWHTDGQATAFFGLAADVPVPGDYDGDGDVDRAVYRNGAWYTDGQATVFFGLGGDIPVPADYDGDGDVDRAVYRPSVGGWYVVGQPTVFLGLPGHIPVPADYDGDGDADRGVYRPDVGGWYVQGQATVFLGLAGYVPVPADYDGDGDADRAVFRPDVGGWYVQGQGTVFLGAPGDVPVPLPNAVYRQFF
jgi:hypothetical protein